ncbi:MAG: NAD(P)/FAD-dependent oxidoreductase [Archaeoglobaceae archaeon]|nr:NAD(P)/FAD-dependent oxidoreductase [Archaeoglobaceae archaeon]
MKIAIVGTGLTGLRCAMELNEFAKVKIFEKNSFGGLLSSFCKDYCIEKFYHHAFKSDSELINLVEELGLSSKLVWNTVKVGFAKNGKIYSLSTPIEILKFPYMSFLEKVRLTLFTLGSKKKRFRDFDEIEAIEAIKNELGENILKNFFMPMLKAKFGENASKVSYAWLLARVAMRSNRKLRGEEIGYLRHGFFQLIDKMFEKCEKVEIIKKNAKIGRNGNWNVNGEIFDAVVFTAPLPELGDFREKLGIPEINYQSSICALLSLKESLSDVYWVNVDSSSFGAIIEHTNFMPLEDYGEVLVYLASYSMPTSDLLNLSDFEIEKIFMKDLRKFGVENKELNWIKIFRAKFSSPIYEKGFFKKITPYKVYDGFYIAGMTSKPNYPERSMNGSLIAGREVAEQIKKDFGFIT